MKIGIQMQQKTQIGAHLILIYEKSKNIKSKK